MSKTFQKLYTIIGWFFTGILIISIIGFLYYFLFTDRHSNELLFDVDVKIVQIGIADPTHMGKGRYAVCTPVLFETVKEPIQYVRFNTCSQEWNVRINDAWIYNHRVGDIVHFKYLRKQRFFDIKEEYRKDLQPN